MTYSEEIKKLYQETVHGGFLPRAYFTTKGRAQSRESPLNAYDEALMDAGIAQCNVVGVSSIIPPDAEKIDPVEITPGTITFVVNAHMDGSDGETIGAGIGYAYGVRKDGTRYGIVAEDHGHKDKQAVEKELRDRLYRMAHVRKLDLETPELVALSIDTIERHHFGSVLAAFVYLPWDPRESERYEHKSNV